MHSFAPVAVANPRLAARVWARATPTSNSIAGVTDFRSNLLITNELVSTVLAWLAKNPGGFGQHNPAMCAFLSDSGGAYCTSIVCRSAPCIPFWLRTTFTFWDTGWPTPATQHPYGVDTKLKLKRRTRVSTRASVRAASCCQRAQQLATNCALEPARGSLDARQGRR